jgi:TonB family protein
MKVVSGQWSVVSCFCFGLFLFFSVKAQGNLSKIAVLVPEKNGQSEKFAEALEGSLAQKFKVLNAALSETAFDAAKPEKSFNQTTDEAKIIGAAIGCDYFLLIKSETLRRFSFSKKEYFESFAAIYLVSSRTGRLVLWRLTGFEDAAAEKSEKQLFDSINNLAGEISAKLQIAATKEFSEKEAPPLEALPESNSPEAKNFRPPLPYKRLTPPYTAIANLYGIEATVDIEIDLDETGRILRSQIVRWAGFGLDEAVTETIHRMNWRPAERNGKTLPLRVLLRYNFKKLDKE